MDENWDKWLNEYLNMNIEIQLGHMVGCDNYRGLASLPDNKFMEDYIRDGNI